MKVDVRLYGTSVGTLFHRDASLGHATEFRMHPSFIEDRGRPVLGQQFEDDPSRRWRTTHRVPAWFSNLLPEPEGPLRRLLADQAGVHPEHELRLLAELGVDLPGAVTMHALDPRTDAPLEVASVREGARPPVAESERLRFSLAGMQLKFSVDVNERGVTVPVRGRGGRWIAKLPDPRYQQVPENEFAMLSWARVAGVDVPDHRLVPVADIDGLPELQEGLTGQRALLVRRFDRRGDGGLTHIEDFAQIRGIYPHDKYTSASYESLGKAIYGLCGHAAFRRYVRRLVFMLWSGNADMHLKNWSLIYPDRRQPDLAPAYDLVSTIVYPGTDQKLALNLNRSKQFAQIGIDAFRRLARKVGVEEAEVVDQVEADCMAISDTVDIIAQWMPDLQLKRLQAHQERLRLRRTD